MKKAALKAAGLALAFSLFAYPAIAQDDAKKPGEPADKCTMTIKAEIGIEGAGTTTLTLTPEHKGALYSWRLSSGGTITAGQARPLS